MTAMEDQYCRIRMVDNIKVNIQHVHGPTTVLVITFLLFQDFIKYLYRQIRVGWTTFQQCKHCKFFKGARMLVNINVFFCFTATATSICINTSVHQMQRECIILTSTTQLQRHCVITATLLIQRQHVNVMRAHYWLEHQSSRTTSTRQFNINTSLERQRISTTPTGHAMLTVC